jgi:hypothetical protein
MHAVFLVIFVEHEDAVGNPYHDNEGWNKTGQDGDFVTEKNNAAKRPNHADDDY